MTIEWAGKRVLVTGASSGIGAGLAEAFAVRGATVGLCAWRAARLREVAVRCSAAKPGVEHPQWVVDLAVPDEVDRLVAAVQREWGSVDILVNNAGIPKRRHVTALDMATVDQVMNINFRSPVQLTLALLPGMVERGSGTVVNVSSVGATLSSPGEAVYDASKSALAVFSEAMAVDLWDTGVRVLVVYPGVVDTELFELPDNDPFSAPVEKIPVSELVEGVFEALDDGRSQVYVPTFFGDIAASKAGDVDGFLAGCADFVRAGKAGGRYVDATQDDPRGTV